MPTKEDFDIQIIITSGVKNIEKATLGFATAVGCATAGGKVVVFMAMEGANFAAEGEGCCPYVSNFEAIDKYIEMLHESNARIEVCTTCVENFTPTEERSGRRKKIKQGVYLAGLSTASIRALSTRTIVF